jgi:hypothetical protein
MAYLDENAEKLVSQLVRANMPVLICPAIWSQTREVEMLVRRYGATALIPREDYTWKDLFRLAFSHRASVVIGSAKIIQGLYKLVRFYGIALKVKHVLVLCDNTEEWMFSDIETGLDCKVHKLIVSQDSIDADLQHLERELLGWTSILDCHVVKGESGLELKVVYFPGERLPKLPSCAKLQMIPWQGGQIPPFSVIPGVKNS